MSIKSMVRGFAVRNGLVTPTRLEKVGMWVDNNPVKVLVASAVLSSVGAELVYRARLNEAMGQVDVRLHALQGAVKQHVDGATQEVMRELADVEEVLSNRIASNADRIADRHAEYEGRLLQRELARSTQVKERHEELMRNITSGRIETQALQRGLGDIANGVAEIHAAAKAEVVATAIPEGTFEVPADAITP